VKTLTNTLNALSLQLLGAVPSDSHRGLCPCTPHSPPSTNSYIHQWLWTPSIENFWLCHWQGKISNYDTSIQNS